MWRCGLVVDTRPRDQEVPGSSPGCARWTLSPWERLFTCISSPHSCVKRVPDYRQYASMFLCNAPQGVEKDAVLGIACRGSHVKRLEHFVDTRYINALFNLIQFIVLHNYVLSSCATNGQVCAQEVPTLMPQSTPF